MLHCGDAGAKKRSSITTPWIFFVSGEGTLNPVNERFDKKMQVTTREAITIVLFTVFTWFLGYITGAEVTRIWEKTMVKFDCIFQPAPEDSSRV